jgi:hypothetical protein
MEQRFKHVGRCAGAFRSLRQERFAFRLLHVVQMDHAFRAMGLLAARRAAA